MAYILKSRRVRRGMPLGDDSSDGGGFFDAVSSAISNAGNAITSGVSNIANTPLTTGSGTVGSAASSAWNAPAPSPGVTDTIAAAATAFFNVFGKSALPTAPTVIVQKAPGLSPTTMIALAVGGVALVALLARRSS